AARFAPVQVLVPPPVLDSLVPSPQALVLLEAVFALLQWRRFSLARPFASSISKFPATEVMRERPQCLRELSRPFLPASRATLGPLSVVGFARARDEHRA